MTLEKKQDYQKPELRKVRLEAKTSVLSSCNTSVITQAKNDPVPGAGCRVNMCFSSPA